ncbi:MAG TPA: hypothetical protein DIU07_15215 [Rhodobacteraceae bacterium]|nr:hypothetical protein [Paracoccaceae bacterium]
MRARFPASEHDLATRLDAIACRPVTGDPLGFSPDGTICAIDAMSSQLTDLGAGFADGAMIGGVAVASDFNNEINAVRAVCSEGQIRSISRPISAPNAQIRFCVPPHVLCNRRCQPRHRTARLRQRLDQCECRPESGRHLPRRARCAHRCPGQPRLKCR